MSAALLEALSDAADLRTALAGGQAVLVWPASMPSPSMWPAGGAPKRSSGCGAPTPGSSSTRHRSLGPRASRRAWTPETGHRERWPSPSTSGPGTAGRGRGRAACTGGCCTACLRSVARFTAYAPFEAVLVESSPAGASQAVAEAALGALPHRVVAYDASAGFNFSRAVNLGTAAARGFAPGCDYELE